MSKLHLYEALQNESKNNKSLGIKQDEKGFLYRQLIVDTDGGRKEGKLIRERIFIAAKQEGENHE